MLERDLGTEAVICDLLMPDMDGIEFFRRAKLIERVTDQGPAPPPPFILLTALRPTDSSRKSEVALLRQATEVGFSEVMFKPVDQERLIRKLAEMEAENSEAESSDGKSDDLQKTIESLRDFADSTEDSPHKQAVLATLQNLEAQLGELEKKPEVTDEEAGEDSD